MRALVGEARIRAFMKELGRSAREPATVYLTGGATAVLHGWRESTVDVDLLFEPERDQLFRALVELKDRLDINLELASPKDFVPVASNWAERSPFIGREGSLSFHHFDLHGQALSKIERGHGQDLADVAAMIERGLVSPDSLWRYYRSVESNLHRYPALDRGALEAALAEALGTEPVE